MEARILTEAIAFNPEKMAKNALFESSHMFYDLYCLRPGQFQKVHAHEGSDKVYYVVSGTGNFTVGDQEANFAAGTAVIARAGQRHGIRNDGPVDLVALVVMAPLP
jgi:mannose-6-phosphate isomerase-like protein (cupin superfamily)